jgi:hypothetical protein
MSQFRAVDPEQRVWQVEDLLPQDQAAEITATDWLDLAWDFTAGQESWPRRQIHYNDPEVQRYSGYIAQQLPQINQALGTEFKQCSGHFWVDQPGFTVPLHTDGHVPNAMQLYWVVPGPEYGTGFYTYKNTAALLYQTQSLPNSGYIMLNHLNADGSQPLLWHAMLNPVPAGHIRVSSYWRFE